MAEYKGDGISGKIKITDTAGNFSSTDLKSVLDELKDGASGGGSSQDFKWKKHESFLTSTSVDERTLPATWKELRIRFLPSGDTGYIMPLWVHRIRKCEVLQRDKERLGNYFYFAVDEWTKFYMWINPVENTLTISASPSSSYRIFVYYKTDD